MAVTHSLFRRPLVPLANVEDAKSTMAALEPYLPTVDDAVIAVHVIEKAGGAPDKASVEQRERSARDIFDAARDEIGDSDVELETEILYGTDIASTIIDAAVAQNASAIVFMPRGAGRLMKLLTGDGTTPLLNEIQLPVLVLPDEAPEQFP